MKTLYREVVVTLALALGVISLTQCASTPLPPASVADGAGSFDGGGMTRRQSGEAAGGLRFGDDSISNNAIDGLLGESGRRSRDLAPPSPAAVADRPGLATQAGHMRNSQVSSQTFFRRQIGHPDVLDVIYYNDEAGARAMMDALGGGRRKKGAFAAAGDRLEVAVRQPWGNAFERYEAGGRRIVVGKGGQSYVISLKNRTDRAIEVVASVDGLDVMDGKAASVKKRGYVLPAKGEMEVAGFRHDSVRVRQFIFGRVADSVAAKAGEARNVGVIGLAVFDEDESKARAFRLAEAQQRGEARAFPGLAR